MRRRLLTSTFLIALTTMIVLGVPLAIVGTELLHQRADMRLERRADAAALRLARAQAHGQPLTTALIADLLPAHEAVRATTTTGQRVTLGQPPSGSAARVSSGDGGPLRVTLVAPSAARNDDVGIVWLAVAASGVAALAAAVALASVQSRRLATPLEQLARRVERVGHPGYDESPVAGHLEEIDQVQRALNEADQRITELVRRERQFTANASHQLRTPLTGLRMRLEELRGLATSPAAVDETGAALGQVDRLVTTIEHLEHVARHRDDEPDSLDVGALITDHLQASGWASRYADAQRALSIDSPHGLIARANPESVRQILDVLLDNALQHGSGATLVRTDPSATWISVFVADQGTGLTPTHATAIFTRGVGDGEGIGLNVARELAQRGGGDLRLSRTTPTTFQALLPT